MGLIHFIMNPTRTNLKGINYGRKEPREIASENAMGFGGKIDTSTGIFTKTLSRTLCGTASETKRNGRI
jgi:hypothetical protein